MAHGGAVDTGAAPAKVIHYYKRRRPPGQGRSAASWVGVLAGITAIVSFFFFPWFVIAAWLVVTSVLVFRAHVEEDATF